MSFPIFISHLSLFPSSPACIRRKCGRATIGENYAVVTTSSRRRWLDETGHCEIFNWFRCWEAAAAFPIDRPRMRPPDGIPGTPGGFACGRRETLRENRHAVVGGTAILLRPRCQVCLADADVPRRTRRCKLDMDDKDNSSTVLPMKISSTIVIFSLIIHVCACARAHEYMMFPINEFSISMKSYIKIDNATHKKIGDLLVENIKIHRELIVTP